MGPQHDAAREEAQALAALDALGPVELEDAAAITPHAPDQSAEAQAFTQVAQLLAVGVTPIAPPARLRERLLARIQAPATPAVEPSAALPAAAEPPSAAPWIVRAQEGRWRDGPAPGLSIKMLFYDATRQYATHLLRIAPGAHVPRHLHAETEELYVLEGSCVFNDELFAVGDYMRMVAGSVHDLAQSDTGCLLLVQGSTRSTILP